MGSFRAMSEHRASCEGKMAGACCTLRASHVSLPRLEQDLTGFTVHCKAVNVKALSLRPRGTQFNNALKRWMYRASGFNQVGLYHDDCLHEDHDVEEALRRMPQGVLDDRNFRMQRALHLSLTKSLLPKEQWISYDEDRAKGRYLQPFLKEVISERWEREEWNKK